MKHGVYSVKDSVVGSFMRPFTHVNDATASRDFVNMVNDPKNDFMRQNHGDMALYRIGTFDDETGEVTGGVEFIVNGASVWKVGE